MAHDIAGPVGPLPLARIRRGGVLQLGEGDRSAIRAHGERAYPREGCGALLGTAKGDVKTVSVAVAVANAFDGRENRADRYLIPPEEIFRIGKEARRRRLDVIGFYHSHPDYPARPSICDWEHAWPRLSYLIVRVAKGKAEEMGSFVLSDDRTAFAPEEIHWTES